jgi:hypothetical protein
MSIETIRSIVRQPSAQHYPAAEAYLKAAGVKYPHVPVRILYLAYAYLRGKAYRVVEPTARPLEDSIGTYQVERFKKDLATVIRCTTLGDVTPWAGTEETVGAWMGEPEPEAHLAVRLAREEESRRAREVRREAHARARAQVA